ETGRAVDVVVLRVRQSQCAGTGIIGQRRAEGREVLDARCLECTGTTNRQRHRTRGADKRPVQREVVAQAQVDGARLVRETVLVRGRRIGHQVLQVAGAGDRIAVSVGLFGKAQQLAPAVVGIEGLLVTRVQDRSIYVEYRLLAPALG